MSNIHVAAVRLEITPVNFSGLVTCVASVDTTSCNLPINDDQLKKNTEMRKYTDIISQNYTDNSVLVELETKSTRIGIAEAFSIKYSPNIIDRKSNFRSLHEGISVMDTFSADKGVTYYIEKFIGVYTSRDAERSKIKYYASKKAEECQGKGFAKLLDESREEWNNRWETADIVIKGDHKAQCAIRYNIFQLISNNLRSDGRVSIGARGLTHQRYKGCYFWDTEIFMLPFFIYTDPLAARNLLKYRYNTLNAAKEHSRKMGTEGARFPWMASYDGSEQCESWDTGACEIHISCDIAYAFDHYIKVTGDLDFLADYAAEVYIETSRFWASRFTYNSGNDRYNLLFTKGPDEYCGVSNNNTYTIYMAINNLKLAQKAIEYLKDACPQKLGDLFRRIDFDEKEIEKWNDIIDKTPINYDEKKNLYIQDDTFMLLEPLELSRYKKDNTPLYHHICFDRLQRYRVLKQADIILLMTLFPKSFTEEQKKAAWYFYEPLTLHDSTLSFGTHALLGAQVNDMPKAVDYLEKSLYLDLDNIMSNTGSEGLHIASLGATWQAVIHGFAGVYFDNGVININPRLPEKWSELNFTLIIQNRKVRFKINKSGWETETID
jgi:kojibiose phosphorylase